MEPLLAALGIVFLAELGDKTQLVALGFGARHKLGPVLAGVALAYLVTNLISVTVGAALGAALPTRAVGIGGGILFLAFAAWNLRPEPADHEADAGDGDGGGDGGGDGDGERDRADDDRTGPPAARVVVSVASAMFLAEFGDKTMLATATLAAQGSAVLVWIGATVGIILAGTIGVLVGRAVGARIPERATRLGSSALFAVFGVVLIVTAS